MYEKEVEKGAAWLDENRPGWYQTVDINVLDLGWCHQCILGLTFGTGASEKLNHDVEFSIPHGFSLRIYHDKSTEEGKRQIRKAYNPLSAEWIREILRRRAKDRLIAGTIERIVEKEVV